MDINMTINGTEDLMTALQSLDPELIKAAAGGLVALYIIAIAAIVYFFARYRLRSIGLCSMYHKAGVACWKLGFEPATIWDIVKVNEEIE